MSHTVDDTKKSKLTKKFYLGIEAGLYLVSNVLRTIDEPVFAEIVGPHCNGELQWGRIVKTGAAQRLCTVFRNVVEYEKWLSDQLRAILWR